MPLKLVIDYTPINKFSFLKKYLLLHVFVLSTCFCLLAQSNVKLFVNYNSIQKGFFENNISYRKIVSDTFAVQKEILIELRAKNEIKQIDSYCSWRRCGICTFILVIIAASGIAAAFGTSNKLLI